MADHSDRVLRIGVEDHAFYPLFSFTGDEQKKSVLETILECFAEQYDVTFEYVPLPITRFKHWYEKDHIDFRVPDNPLWNSEQSESLKFSEPMMYLSQSTVVLAENQHLRLQQFERLGTLYGFTPSQHWQSRIESGELELVTDSSIKLLIRLLYSGVVQGLDLDIAVVRHYAEELGYNPEQLVLADGIQQSTIGYRMSTLKHPALLKQLNEFIATHEHKIQSWLDAKGINAVGE
ncbi:hypothetical protein [Saliniradius amylolyticus]|uniref:hypothetical protein n=1 Tax=Saliniradius amylolyticus TaxID=2183582 RepID=UPI00194F8843|nr:hypothetical protein [Saliniradius amylolyticus]